MEKYSIIRPDDFHCHLRIDEMMRRVIPFSNHFGKVVAMGNLTPPIATGQDAVNYKRQILDAGATFEPIMSIMLTKETKPSIIYDAWKMGVKVLKFLPGGTSTGSQQGIALKDLPNYYHVIKEVLKCDMVFSGHWELMNEGGAEISEYQREARAIPYLLEVIQLFPDLKIVVEHVSTADMVDCVINAPQNVAATVTAHHIGPYQWDDVFDKCGNVTKPYLYCKPVLKSRPDVDAVSKAAFSGNPKFFFGSDSAPHPSDKKLLGKSPAAGIFSAPVVIPWLWECFINNGKTAKDFENFTAVFGSNFYGLPVNTDTLALVQEVWQVPSEYDGVVPFLARKELNWQILD